MTTQATILNAISAGRRNARKLVRQADSARDSGDHTAAAALYRQSLALHSTSAIHIQCGHMLKELGRMEEAETEYLQALTLTPKDPDLHLQIGHLYKVWNRWADAVTAYERAVKLGLPVPDELRYARLRQALHVVGSLLVKSFDGERYLTQNAEVQQSGMNPFDHFIHYGVYEGRLIEQGRVNVQLTRKSWLKGVPNR